MQPAPWVDEPRTSDNLMDLLEAAQAEEGFAQHEQRPLLSYDR
jgi:hypothetical protein